MKRYGVRPICPLQQRVASLLLWAWWIGDINRLLCGREQEHSVLQQKRVVPRFQHTYVAAYRLVRSGRLHIGPEEREGKGGGAEVERLGSKIFLRTQLGCRLVQIVLYND